MTRTILAGLAALALSACATFGGNVELSGAAARGVQVAAVATLATNACEAATAAGYTQTIVARRTARSKLEKGVITVEQALRVQGAADEARAALDATCAGAQTNNVMLLLAADRVNNLRKVMEALP